MIYKPDKFELYEVLPKEFYEAHKYYGDKLWWMFDSRALWTIEQLRRVYGTAVLNDWYWDGINQYRGWRPFDSKVGALISQHKFGRAFDLKFKYHTSEEIREDILKDPDNPIFKYIMCIEEGVSWFHFDVRSWDRYNKGILMIKPRRIKK